MLPLKFVWDWYEKIPNIHEGISTSPLGRAIATVGIIFGEKFYDENNMALI